MMKSIGFIIVICYLFYFINCGTLPSSQLAEQTLITSLLNGYNKNIRPSTVVSVDITATLQQIVGLDEKQQILTSSSFISQIWVDDRLSWTPNATFNYVEVVMLPVKNLWIPDTMIINSADSSGYLTVSDYSFASVDYTGQVYMILPALTIKTRCGLYVSSFPFDKQICTINLTSWSQGANRILYTENSSEVLDTSYYTEHPLWKLNGTDVIVYQGPDRVLSEDTYNDIISIQLYLQRKPLFFIMNGIFACLILNCVTLLSFALPFGTQIGLCMTCFMTYSVYSLSFANLFPQQSDYLMMLTLYFLLSIVWTFVSMAWFIICNHYISKNDIPKSLYSFCGMLQKLFCCCFSQSKDEKKKDKEKDVIIENGELKKSGDKESIKGANTKKMKCVCCQKLFVSCLSKHNKVESNDTKQYVVQENMESMKTNTRVIEPIETTPYLEMSEENEKPKAKCDFCNRCESCQADLDKDKAKRKKKDDIEAKCSALNYFMLFCIVLCMFISDMAVWLLMAK